MKKTICMFLAVMFVICMLPLTVMADPECEHDFCEWECYEGDPNDCTSDKRYYRTCYLCGEEEEYTDPGTEHAWDEGIVQKKPTADKEGEMVYVCYNCGKTKTEKIPADPSLKPQTTTAKQTTTAAPPVKTTTTTTAATTTTTVAATTTAAVTEPAEETTTIAVEEETTPATTIDLKNFVVFPPQGNDGDNSGDQNGNEGGNEINESAVKGLGAILGAVSGAVIIPIVIFCGQIALAVWGILHVKKIRKMRQQS